MTCMSKLPQLLRLGHISPRFGAHNPRQPTLPQDLWTMPHISHFHASSLKQNSNVWNVLNKRRSDRSKIQGFMIEFVPIFWLVRPAQLKMPQKRPHILMQTLSMVQIWEWLDNHTERGEKKKRKLEEAKRGLEEARKKLEEVKENKRRTWMNRRRRRYRPD